MKGINKVILIGNLGSDPDVRYTPNGSCVVKLSVATSESWNDKQTGQKKEKTEWHNVVLFGKSGEAVHQYLHKGSKVYVEGKLQTQKWQDSTTGQDRYRTSIAVDGFHTFLLMLDNKPNQPVQQQPQQPAQQRGGYPQHPQQPTQQEWGGHPPV